VGIALAERQLGRCHPVVAVISDGLAPGRTDLSADASPRGVRHVSVGAMAGGTIALPSAALRGSRLEILGSGTGNFPPVENMASIVAEILHFAAEGRLKLDIACYDTAQAATAWEKQAAPDERPVLIRR
jgi:NADPH:quinone reductase-like Zn-dependent oxidoreductase